MRRALIAAAAAVVLIAIAGAAGYVYFFSNLRSSPSTPGLSQARAPPPARLRPPGPKACPREPGR